MIQFYNEYNQELTNTQRPVAYLTNGNIILPIKQLGWAHNIVLMQRVKDLKARYWYMIQCIKNSWSRDFLVEAIKRDFYNTHGALANNFSTTLPEVQAEQVQETPAIYEQQNHYRQQNRRNDTNL